MNFDWNQAQAFIVTAELGSLTAAAKQLSSSQPTVGRQVSLLEASLGLTLFERTANRLILTPTGQRIYHAMKGMRANALNAALAAEGSKQELAGKVVIAASQVDALYRLPPIIRELRNLQPSICVDVVVSNQVSDLQGHEADIAIRSFRPSQDNLIAKKIKDLAVWLYGSNLYVQNLPSKQTTSALQSVKLCGFDDVELMLRILNDNGWNFTKENISVCSDFQPMHIQLAQIGIGLAFIPEDIGDKIEGMERAFRDSEPPLQLAMWLVCHQELKSSKRIKFVFDLLSKRLEDTSLGTLLL